MLISDGPKPRTVARVTRLDSRPRPHRHRGRGTSVPDRNTELEERMHRNDPRPVVEYHYSLHRRPRRGRPTIPEARRDVELSRTLLATSVP